WVDQELWFINTRFSCLCTLDASYSFVPRWRPPFITGYDLTDRCHLNGLGIRDHQPRYVTALGETDRPNGWRANKANGGILIDITTDEIVVRGLSMPHSPRWYRDRLWVLESGRGTLAQVDLATGTLTTVVELPGFTRGIDFWGDLAFVGLSQIRETAVFSGIPLTQTLTERTCGVWVVNIASGEIVGFLKFEDAVQEIFAVSVLPGLHFPELVEHDNDVLLSSSYVLPNAALAEVVPSTPDQPSADRYFEQGCACYEAGEREAAVAAFQQCLALQPDYLPARYNLGVVWGELGRDKTAIAYLHQVIAADASHADAHKTLGHLYGQQNQLEPARRHYEQAVHIRPQDAQAHYNLGMTCLASGDFETGWAECEWRWQTAEFTLFNCPQPRWQGQPLPQQTLLIHTEQGVGDAIQFIRYVSWAAARCQRVILVCPAPLLPLLEKLPGVDQCQTPGEIALNAFDAYLPLMSLPYLARTTVETIPAQVPYLQADASRCPLPSQKKTRRVGIVWAGSPTHGNDRQRSTQLADWLPILRVPEVEFFSLQKGLQVQALADLPRDINVQNLDAVIHDYADTASVVIQLDLIIGVDTSVIHLAGALGRPCWTLLC
ncbi:MAG: TIGR03032 family protein, partial [Cyanobacteria bacterium P01_C01_bin.147]